MSEELSCNSCGKEYVYDKSDKRGNRRNKCAACRQKSRVRENKRKIVAYKGGECSRCGYDECISALTFHHINPEEKEFKLSGNGLKKSWEKMTAEADKCKLLCANCHQKKHCNQCE